jgi:SAM-dependent methyltransferase
MNREALDWTRLDRLRARFLAGGVAAAPYWQSTADLAAYDFTYGERIGWKWDSLLAELRRRAWPGRPDRPWRVLDWGCGSGVAGRRVIRHLGADHVGELQLWDHSTTAMDFARAEASRTFPGLRVRVADPDGTPDLVVASHVVNELAPVDLGRLESLFARAPAVLWLEPGTHAVSRTVQAWRERLVAGGARVIAPCTHHAACGLLHPGRERDWCHQFAVPPAGVHADRNWVRFAQRAGVDLRSLPYACLAIDRAPVPAGVPGLARVIGRPEVFKPYARVLSCDESGATTLTLPRRTLGPLVKQLERARGPLVYRWTREEGTVTAGECDPVLAAPGLDSPAATGDA